MSQYVKYKSETLAKNSEAYKLLEEAKKTGDYKKLDKHLREVNKRFRELHGL